jgi:hypothetical protein
MRTGNRLALAAALLTFAFTGAAGAQNEAWRDHYPDWTDGRADRRYVDSRYRPNPRQIPVLAHDVEEVATAIHRRFERNNRRPNRAEVQVMRNLHRLEESAERFHDQVGRGNGVRRGGDEYAALENAFWATARSLRTIGRRDYVDRGMQRIHARLGELGVFYGRRADGRDRWDGHGGYDRWDDRDRDRRWDDDRRDDDRRRH